MLTSTKDIWETKTWKEVLVEKEALHKSDKTRKLIIIVP